MNNQQITTMPANAEFVEVVTHAPPAKPEAPVNPILLVHSFLRGRYKLAIVLALVLAPLGAVVGYVAQPATYRSTGLIRVRPNLQKILFQTDENGVMPMFESFIGSQLQFITSQRVIDAAMQDPKWKALGRGLSPEAISEFNENLEVGRPRGGELIIVAFTDPDPSAAAIAVTAVINAYLRFYANNSDEAGAPRMDVLENRRNELDAQLRRKNQAIFEIAKEFGSDTLQRQYDFKVDELLKVESQLRQAQLALAVGEAIQFKAVEAGPTTEPAVADILEFADTELASYRREKRSTEIQIEILSARYKEDHPAIQKLRMMVRIIDRSIAERVQHLTERGAVAGTGAPGAYDPRIPQSAEQLRATQQRIQMLYDRVKAETLDLGRKNLEIANLRNEVESIKARLEQTAARIEHLQLEEKNTGGRITMISEGERPLQPYKDKRKKFAAVGGIGMGGLGIACVMLLGFLDRRLHQLADAETNVRQSARVLGIIPDLPEGQLDLSSATVATHCVHHVRAMLQQRRNGEEHRTFTVTSPSSGDGKTTLVIALGMSYAASGSRTLLLDLDLVGGGLSSRLHHGADRKFGEYLVRAGVLEEQKLEQMLQCALESNRSLETELIENGTLTDNQLDRALIAYNDRWIGLSGVLSGRRVSDCAVPTSIRSLYLLPLGSAGREELGQLSPELIGSILNDARESFDMVLIDTGPVLGSLEASMAVGESSGVILTVARGGNKTMARRATEFLIKSGARLEGVVFNRAQGFDVQSSDYSSYASRTSQRRTRRAHRSRLAETVAAAPAGSAGPAA